MKRYFTRKLELVSDILQFIVVAIPAKSKKEVGVYARNFGTASTIKKFATKYPKYSFIGTVNIRK